MAQVYKKLVIDVNKSNPGIIAEAVQNDANSRFLDIVLVDGSTPINLTGHEVRIYGKKYDGTEFYNNGEITEPTAGRCQFELTSQALAVANDLEVQIIVFYNNVEVLSTQAFRISVVKSLMSASAIESSNEYGALVVLYQNLYEAYDLMVEMVQKIGVPGEQAQLLNLDTMFEVWDWMVAYLQANSTAGVVEAVNSINSKIGTSSDISSNSLFGAINKGVVKSVQRGTVSSGSSATIDITISAVDVNKSIVLCYASNLTTSGANGNRAANCKLVDATTIMLYSAHGTGIIYPDYNWQVIEFY